MSAAIEVCEHCRIEAKRQAGGELTQQEFNAWAMWGCTCNPEDEANAIAFMDRMTR